MGAMPLMTEQPKRKSWFGFDSEGNYENKYVDWVSNYYPAISIPLFVLAGVLLLV